MSALDELRQFERQWERHQRWREQNKYVGRENGAFVVRLGELPTALVETFVANAELIIGGAIEVHYVDELERLRKVAVDEAERVLRELKK